MKRVFGILMISLVAVGSQANPNTDPGSNAGIEIAQKIENNHLDIEVDDALAGAKVTVSVFNSTGEIVLETSLNLGLNKVDVQELKQGDYVAVVRENGEYTSKQSFKVS